MSNLSFFQGKRLQVNLIVNDEDLQAISSQLVDWIKVELSPLLSPVITATHEEKYLTQKEVKEICSVCDATLWQWNRKGYLKKVKLGNKVLYKQSDIKKILEEKQYD